MPSTDIQCGLALARMLPPPPNEQDWNLLVAWPWSLSPWSAARQAFTEGPVSGVLTLVKSLCLCLHLQNEWIGLKQHFST